MMNTAQIKVALSAQLNGGECYSYQALTLSKMLGVEINALVELARDSGYNVFSYGGVCYIGSDLQKNHYYYDKLLGQNPFYQTS